MDYETWKHPKLSESFSLQQNRDNLLAAFNTPMKKMYSINGNKGWIKYGHKILSFDNDVIDYSGQQHKLNHERNLSVKFENSIFLTYEAANKLVTLFSPQYVCHSYKLTSI